MSFFDDDREELPPRRPPQRRAGRLDDDAVRRRRLFALGAGLILLVILFLGIRGCMSVRKERAYKDYVREVAGDARESQQESAAVFALLRGQADQRGVALQNSINGFRTEAGRLVDRARKRDRPDELADAHRYLIDTLTLRRDGLAQVARLLPTALGDQGAEQATRDLAAQMQTFLASDVVFTQRFLPRLYSVIEKEGLEDDVPIPEPLRKPAGFLQHVDWLRPTTVADRIARHGGGGGGASDEPAAPGLHGTGVQAVTVQPSGTALNPGAAVDIASRRNITFDVQIQNQGEHEEQDVTVRLTISGAGKPITVEDSIDAIAAGETQTASIPLPRLPTTGRPVTIRVQVEPVPGEQKTDNNRQTYQAVFTS